MRWSVWYWIVCIYAVLFLCLGFKACVYVHEARGAEPTELSTTDKVKIAGGCFLSCLMAPVKPDKETKVYDADGLIRDPLPKEIEKEE